MKKVITQIKLEATKLKEKSDEELNGIIQGIKTKKDKNSLFLNKEENYLLIEWFALVQEIAFRKIGLRHFDTQLLAGLLLNEGQIVEMKTGEGKTLVSTLPASFNALTKKSVHIVTVNEYLAERDQKWMGKVYKGLGLSCGLVKSSQGLKEKKENYLADITYVTNSELVFDYLRDSSAYSINEIVQKPLEFCLIDEIDSILIDESRTPLILSGPNERENLNKLYLAKKIIDFLEKDLDFELDEKRRDVYLTEKGYKEINARLGKTSLFDAEDPWVLEILNALKANYLFKLNKDYIVLNNKIVIVDEFTGRIMEDRRWSMGLHEAVEVKENVEVGLGTKTKSSITYQNFFTLYPKLSGMTGTAKTTEKEFKDIYNLDVVVLATTKPMIRKDLPDLVYQTELSKWKAVLKESQSSFEKGQPILIGTSSIEKSEFLSDLFKLSNIPHQLLNAKPENVFRENEIIAQAGKRYAVTIATNMAGRGTDIILGGNPLFEIKEQLSTFVFKKKIYNSKKYFFKKDENFKKEEKEEKELDSFLLSSLESRLLLSSLESTDSSEFVNKNEKIQKILHEYENNEKQLKLDIENLPYSLEDSKQALKDFYNDLYKTIYKNWEKENKKVKELGGLFVLGTERHETRRIDNQLRGRAGRQGDPGISRFFVSLEDDLIKVFGGDSIRRWINYLIEDENTPLESDLLTKSLEKAQKKVEMYNYDLRKNVFQYDTILNHQRKQLFKARNEILFNNCYEEFFLRSLESSFDEELLDNKKKVKSEAKKTTFQSFQNLKFENISHFYAYYYSFKKKTKKIKEVKQLYKEIWINHDLRLAHSNFYELGFLKNTQAITLLSIIDFYWTEHIERMGYIRETINWKAYGQQNPLTEYNKEAFKSFKLMFEEIRSSMIYSFLNNSIY